MADPITVSIGTGVISNAVWAAITLFRLHSLGVRLTGRWEGKLTCSEEGISDEVLDCVLVLALPANRQLSGLIYYRRHNTRNAQTLGEGLDQLHDWKQSRKGFSLDFIRIFHKCKKINFDISSAKYIFHCNITGGKLYIETDIPNCSTKASDKWQGCFKKQ